MVERIHYKPMHKLHVTTVTIQKWQQNITYSSQQMILMLFLKHVITYCNYKPHQNDLLHAGVKIKTDLETLLKF